MLREFLLCSKRSQLYVYIYPIHTYRSWQHWVHFPVLSCRSLLVIYFIHTTGYKILGHSRTHPNCPGQIENSTCVCVCVCVLSHFSPVWLFATPWTEPSRLLRPWDSPGKNTGVGCHFLLQGIFLTQGLNLSLLHVLHCRWIFTLNHLKPENSMLC